MIKHRQKLEHSREEMKESVGSEKVAGEENRDSLIEPGIQGMRGGLFAAPSSTRKMGHTVKLV